MSEEEPERPFLIGADPYAGFEMAALTDKPVYVPGDVVRITVALTHGGDAWFESLTTGWQRVVVSIRDERHASVADDRIDRPADEPLRDRWAPGQRLLLPTWWNQTEGPIVPAWSSEPIGPRVAPGRYRVRATWLGRVTGSRAEVPDAHSGWFTIV